MESSQLELRVRILFNYKFANTTGYVALLRFANNFVTMASDSPTTPSTSIELDTPSLNDMLRRMQEAPEDDS
jgi:hypothetical protein